MKGLRVAQLPVIRIYICLIAKNQRSSFAKKIDKITLKKSFHNKSVTTPFSKSVANFSGLW